MTFKMAVLAAVLGMGLVGAAGPAPSPQEESLSIPEVAERVTRSVVTVYTSRTMADPECPYGKGAAEPPASKEWYRGLGSGVVVAADGLVLTNHHVVEDAVEIQVMLPDRRELRAKLIGSDRETDLAVLRIQAEGLSPLPFADSTKVRVGETVLAVGNTLGIGQTVSRGIVSAQGRANLGITEYEDFIQTDGVTHVGNSGGPLVNLKGEIVGINTAIASRKGSFGGIGFAISSQMARDVMHCLLRDGHVVRNPMGLAIQDMTPTLAAAIPGAPARGVLVADVEDGGPASKGGMQAGDIVLAIDGRSVESAAQLRNRAVLRPEIKLNVWRTGKVRDLTLHTAKQPDQEANGHAPVADRTPVEFPAGITLVPLTPDMLERDALPGDLKGLVITGIDRSVASSFSGLAEGDVILEVGGSSVHTIEALKKALPAEARATLFRVRRGDTTLFVAVPRR
jgi:serine protease Do